jgi:hypothetical protein
MTKKSLDEPQPNSTEVCGTPYTVDLGSNWTLKVNQLGGVTDVEPAP